MNRRDILRTVGGAGSAAAVGALGLGAFTGSAAATQVDISAANPGVVQNDRGDVSKVTIDPTFRVEWEGFDQAVAKVFYVIEAKTGSGSFAPIFRSTPWLTGSTLQGVQASKAGTTGFLELVDPLSQVLNRSAKSREGNNYQPPRPLPRPLEVANEQGRPDYENADFSSIGGVTAESFVGGNSVGSADTAESVLVDQEGLPLVNNFPGADSGYYGAAGDTSRLDNDADGTQSTTQVTLRYTFALKSANQSFVNFVGPTLGEGALAHVRQSDVESDSQGNSVLVMNGEDGYADITSGNAFPASTNDYDTLQYFADKHPAIITETATFNIRAKNEAADAGVTGSSNTGAQ